MKKEVCAYIMTLLVEGDRDGLASLMTACSGGEVQMTIETEDSTTNGILWGYSVRDINSRAVRHFRR